MPAHRMLFLFATLSCLPLWASGQTVHRCEDSTGHVTFTTLSCSPGEALSLQQADAFSLGHTEVMPPAAPPRMTSGNKTRRKEPTIVGQFEDDCGNLIDANQRREAIMHRRVIAGMSQQDVESALGRPDTIKVRNSTTRYLYKARKGRSAEFVFDERGCIKGKSQTAKSPR